MRHTLIQLATHIMEALARSFTVTVQTEDKRESTYISIPWI